MDIKVKDTWPVGIDFMTAETLADMKASGYLQEITPDELAVDPTKRAELQKIATDFIRGGSYVKEIGADGRERVRMVPRSNVTIVRGGEIIRDVPAYQVPMFADIGEAWLTPGSYGVFTGQKPKEVMLARSEADDRWKLIFRTVSTTKYNGERYDRADMGIQFEQLELGEAPKFGKVTGTYTTLPNLEYGAGMLLHKIWLRENEVWRINDMFETARRKAAQKLSQFMFALLKAASFNGTALAGTAVAVADLNGAYARLVRNYVGTNTDDTVYNPGDPLVIVCPVERVAEILTCIRLAQVVGYAGDQLVFPTAVVIDTKEYTTSDKKIDIIAPQREFIFQEYDPLYTNFDFDIATEAQRHFWRYRNNGLVRTAKAGERLTWS